MRAIFPWSPRRLNVKFSFFHGRKTYERGPCFVKQVRPLDEIDEYVDGSFLPFLKSWNRIIVQRTTLAYTRATWRKKSFAFLTFSTTFLRGYSFCFRGVSYVGWKKFLLPPLLLLLLPGSTVFARLPIFARPFHRELYERASAFWRRVLFTSDAENVYPGCMRLKGCMR